MMYNILSESKENVIGIKLKGFINTQDFATLLPYLDQMINKHGTIRLLTDLREFKGIEFYAILRIPFQVFKYSSAVEKEAVITEEEWVYTWAKLLASFVKTEVRCFPPSKIEEAWKWVHS